MLDMGSISKQVHYFEKSQKVLPKCYCINISLQNAGAPPLIMIYSKMSSYRIEHAL